MSQASVDLISEQHYPRDWKQFLSWFGDEQRRLSYLEGLRWPSGFVCPRCGESDQPMRVSRGRLMCWACRHQASVIAGTVFDKTRTPH